MHKDSTVRLLSGRQMPIIGLGTWQLGENGDQKIGAAISMGYRMIDTSGDYGTQANVGRGLKSSGVNRDDIFIVTKVEEDEDSYDATKRNLNQLGLEYVDLMLIHRPPRDGSAGHELWHGLIRAKAEGLVRDIGVSNYSEEQVQELASGSNETPVVNQIEWSPFGFSEEMHDFCRQNDIVIQAYSPLTRAERLEDAVLQDLSDKYEVSPAQILLRWDIQMGVVPIVKASQARHMRENIEVFDFELSREDMEDLASLNEMYSSLASKPTYIR